MPTCSFNLSKVENAALTPEAIASSIKRIFSPCLRGKRFVHSHSADCKASDTTASLMYGPETQLLSRRMAFWRLHAACEASCSGVICVAYTLSGRPGTRGSGLLLQALGARLQLVAGRGNQSAPGAHAIGMSACHAGRLASQGVT